MENRIKISDGLITEYYEEYRSSVFFYISRRIENQNDAEDLTQDAFLRLLEVFPFYDSAESVERLPASLL